MHLHFKSQRGPIRSLISPDLPKFSLIIGPNGSGKTHLLQAIKGGNISCEGVAYSKSLLYDAQTFRFEEAESAIAANSVEVWHRGVADKFSRILASRERALKKLAAAGIEESAALELTFSTRNYSEGVEIGNLLSEFDREFNMDDQLQLIAGRLNKRVLALTEEDLRFFPQPGQKEDPLKVAIAEKFSVWRDELDLVRYQRFSQEAYGTPYKLISDEEFFAHRGQAPWQVFNEFCASAEFPYTISAPHPERGAPYKPRLIRKRDGKEVLFSHLSSGEQTLLQLIMCSYARSLGDESGPLGLLLLDEVDGNLHPSLTKKFVDVLENVLVRDFGAAVIATTHSPSTVAFAPEESVFTLTEYDDGHRIEKVSKDRALKVLTSGVPTLSFSYDGRRQVFCEDDSDRDLYTRLFALLSDYVDSPRSLEFIGTGVRIKKNSVATDVDEANSVSDVLAVNTGCQVVCSIVRELSKSGHKTAYGLVDWDSGANGGIKDHPNIVTLAKGSRYSIENAVLDPLIIATLLVAIGHSANISLPSETSLLHMAAMQEAELQAIVDTVQNKILEGADDAELVRCQYIGDFSLSIAKPLLMMNGHKLARRALDCFLPLRELNRGRQGSSEKKLLDEAVNSAIRHIPRFVPLEVLEAFRELLERDYV